MKAKFFVIFSLVLSFGLTFARNLNQSKSGQHSTAQDKSDPWNPLAELLGLKDHSSDEEQGDDLSHLFEIHSRNMDRAMKEHQEAMDKAMDEHQRIIDSAFGGLKPILDSNHKSAMAEHQRVMDEGMAQHQKDMQDFDKDWAEFDKDMNKMFEEFDKHFEEVSDPFEQLPQGLQISILPAHQKKERHIIGTDEKMAEQEGAKNQTGLPVFHPNETNSEPVKEPNNESSYQLPALINHIMDGFKPVLDDLQKEVQDRINSTYQKAEKAQLLNKALTAENTTKSNDNSSGEQLFSHFMDNVANTVAEWSSLIVDSLGADQNETLPKDDSKLNVVSRGEMSDLDNKLKIAYVLHALENVLMARMTQVSFEDTDADLQNLWNLGYNEDDIKAAEEKVTEILHNNKEEAPLGLTWVKEPWEVYDIQVSHVNKIDILDNVVQVVSGRLLSYLEENEKKNKLDKETLARHTYIEKQIRTEFKIKHDDDYEWYEWVTVALIAGTSTLLLIVALFMCVQRSQRRRSVRLDTEGQGVNGVANENLNNKYTEKIKTIFVNLKP